MTFDRNSPKIYLIRGFTEINLPENVILFDVWQNHNTKIDFVFKKSIYFVVWKRISTKILVPLPFNKISTQKFDSFNV